MFRSIGLGSLFFWILSATGIALAEPPSELDRCLEKLPRVARAIDPSGRVVLARVESAIEGAPVSFITLAEDGSPLREVFERASTATRPGPVWKVSAAELPARLCAPVHLSQAEIDAEQRVVVAAGLNYAAHAQEAGGGDVFIFPKPVAPTPPYGSVTAPAGVSLLDYEVELGFVLFDDVKLRKLPSRDALLASSAFLVTNDVSDREAIIVNAEFGGPGTGFVTAKGQPSFLPAGPWMVRGSELFAGLEACGANGLGIRLEVDEGEGFGLRQDASTARMILDPRALLARIADEVETNGLRTAMSVQRGGKSRYYPLALGDAEPRLPAGSLVLTGTPEGVALQAPSPVPVMLRGLLRLRGPFEQFRQEELERARTQQKGGYLRANDRMRSSIDGLGAQIVRIGEAGDAAAADPCSGS